MDAKGKCIPIVVAVLITSLFFQAVLSMRLKSLTYDEVAHLPAGYSYLKTGDYRLNSEHPPLIKLLAAAPLLFFDLTLPSFNNYHYVNPQYEFGRDFIYRSGNDADRIAFWGRIPMVLLSVLLAFYVFIWSRKLFGEIGALLSLFFYIFCPQILAHSRLVTMDLGMGCFILISCYYVWSYLENPAHKSRLVLAGFFTGFAITSKFSSVMLFPIFLTMLVYRIFLDKSCSALFLGNKEISFQDKLKFSLYVIFVVTAISIVIVFMVYGFKADSLNQYISGFKMVYWNQVQGYQFFLNGNYSTKPFWYYYLFAFIIKTTIPSIIAIITSSMLMKRYKLYDLMWLLLPVLLVLVSSCLDGRNLGLRRVVAVYPFLYVCIGSVADLTRKGKYFDSRVARISLVVLICCWHLYSSAKIYPDYLTYFNEIIGGPSHGIDYLDDSNIDWGQDLKQLKTYMDEIDINKISLLYFGTADSKYYGINAEFPSIDKLISAPQPGYYAISVHMLGRMRLSVIKRKSGLDWLKIFKPIHVIGNSLYIYKL